MVLREGEHPPDQGVQAGPGIVLVSRFRLEDVGEPTGRGLEQGPGQVVLPIEVPVEVPLGGPRSLGDLPGGGGVHPFFRKEGQRGLQDRFLLGRSRHVSPQAPMDPIRAWRSSRTV